MADKHKIELVKDLKAKVLAVNDAVVALQRVGCECRISITDYNVIGSGKSNSLTVEVMERIE